MSDCGCSCSACEVCTGEGVALKDAHCFALTYTVSEGRIERLPDCGMCPPCVARARAKGPSEDTQG